MRPVQLARLRESAGMGDHLHLVHQVAGITGHALRLVCGVQSLLQVLVMGGNAGGAGILVALQ